MGPDMVGSEMYVGTSFGELAMLTDVKRTATVRAMGNVSCLKLSKASIAPIIAQVRCTATTGDRLLLTARVLLSPFFSFRYSLIFAALRPEFFFPWPLQPLPWGEST